MPESRTVRARFFFHPDDDTTAPAIGRGCVVKPKAATGPSVNNRYLVRDIDDAAGIAYLSTEIGASGTFAADDDRVARLVDLDAVSPAVSTRGPSPVTPIGADDQGALGFPPDVVAAYEVLAGFLARKRAAA